MAVGRTSVTGTPWYYTYNYTAADFSNTATGSYTGSKYVTFTSSGSLVVTKAGFADIVVVGGGGGTGNYAGGAGGGGVLQVTDAFLPIGTLTVIVGAGGTNEIAGTGNSSRLSSYYGVGGGSGPDRVNGSPGGSGSGGTSGGVTGGSGLSGQGNNGGSSNGTTYAGGGGAGGPGNGVNGGPGIAITIAGTTPTGAYVAGSYLVGGGGGGQPNGIGGSGGGGNGSSSATNGTANTGGGAGVWVRSGGSGIVIVRVAV
jgi:hypothetical protein